jgi:hypothetical protein
MTIWCQKWDLIDWDELLHRVPISRIMKMQQMFELLFALQEQMIAEMKAG